MTMLTVSNPELSSEALAHTGGPLNMSLVLAAAIPPTNFPDLLLRKGTPSTVKGSGRTTEALSSTAWSPTSLLVADGGGGGDIL